MDCAVNYLAMTEAGNPDLNIGPTAIAQLQTFGRWPKSDHAGTCWHEPDPAEIEDP